MTETAALNQPITEDWLRSVGFKWHTVQGGEPSERNPRHWVLWMGGVANDEPGQVWRFHDDEDLGIEISYGGNWWYCWLRSDTSHRYSRFLHVRHIRYQHEAVQLVEALSGKAWDSTDHMYGKIFTPEQAQRIRERDKRLDIRIAKDVPWRKTEKDDSSGRALPEHKEIAEHRKDG